MRKQGQVLGSDPARYTPMENADTQGSPCADQTALGAAILRPAFPALILPPPLMPRGLESLASGVGIESRRCNKIGLVVRGMS